MNDKRLPILCVDFDGVIHSYTSGWSKEGGAAVILDGPVPGAIAFLREAVKHFTVAIHSSRSHQEGGISAMAQWLGYWVSEERLSDDEELAWASAIQWPREKPPAMVSIDDRAIQFTGKWPSIERLKAFQPWNKPQAVELARSPLADMDDPTPEMLDDPRFNAIWNVIKSWDINVPDAYRGYMGATGNHARAIFDGLGLSVERAGGATSALDRLMMGET